MKLFPLFSLLAISALSPSCQNKKLAQEIIRQEDHIAELKEKHKQALDDVKEKENSTQFLEYTKAKNESLTKKLLEANELLIKGHQLYLEQINESAVGQIMEELKIGNKIYQNARILKVTNDTIRVRHHSGIIAIPNADLPESWANKYAIKWHPPES